MVKVMELKKTLSLQEKPQTHNKTKNPNQTHQKNKNKNNHTKKNPKPPHHCKERKQQGPVCILL